MAGSLKRVRLEQIERAFRRLSAGVATGLVVAVLGLTVVLTGASFALGIVVIVLGLLVILGALIWGQ
jgi:hypothetical protein